ncbi:MULTISPECIES: cytochrome c nitrite reductase pentaheme subunit [Basfia]|uniref:Cytochrome c-type protein NrfB-like domain-containing protein n=2 Tax=Basfia TaxID=697331 RepID=Q65RI5_MANSM|nr:MULTISPECIES: cytochrome c nitrite reductase pentaheme subunit [Basfia]AAU38425.1 unknown [[Mannheimia] succiniciproducens MBEL55E]QIM69062.1 cytochrome c nitrite reductase pentaheme subunit [Basfia succiniciproducens]SCY19990.1 respiratory nitrite reductase specific menaquinol--cytochrome-c reductase complex subunit NrfB precursor [Basfia succiniciproducens]SEQ44999.1 respiratory nitrite reductase specific menaquinol--cytochrome-c reductase complex subunit NrfB precursor [Basfia succinicipr
MNSVLKKFAKLSALFGVMLFATTVQAEQAKVDAKQESPVAAFDQTLDNVRDPNKYCAQCHNLDTSKDQAVGTNHAGKFHGTHLTKNNPATGKPITCVSCHGNISEDHRKGAKDVMRFESDIFSTEQPMYSVQEQNQVCFSCHKPDDLRKKLWAHDVHAMKAPCASCHTLHPAKDAMKDIEPKERVKICVDCHSEQRLRKEAADAAQSATEQKDKQ